MKPYYTRKLSAEISNIVKNNKDLLTGLIGSSQGLKKPASKTYTIDETVEKYNPGITADEIKAWVWYRKKQGVPMHSWKSYFVVDSEKLRFNWMKKGVLFYDGDNYVPYAVFTFGNIYTKLHQVKSQEEFIVKTFGQSVYNNHIEVLEKLKPTPLSVSNPVATERPIILAISEFPKTFKINTLKESTGVILEEEVTLLRAFEKWLKSLTDEEIRKTTPFEIIAYYIENQPKPRNIEKIEWQEIKKITRDEGERLFKEFLHTALENSDQIKIDAHYNSTYNATAPLQYQKIPIGIEVSRTFMGFPLEVRKAQREGIAFMELVGSGIVAYDVGVGKTITAIIEVATAIKNGKCSRPLIAVPNPTYKNWIKEMIGDGSLAGVLTGTGITINDWFNLGTNYDHVNLDKEVSKNSITLVSYEGLQKIGFNEFTQQEHFEQLAKIVGQDEDNSARDIEKQKEKFREIIGVGLKDTIADIETLGFDYVVIDEAHNFKNVFSEVKSDKDGDKHFHIKGGSPSNRAIKAFFLCNYIQRKFGRNVMLLTATPFTNSPLEIYSMLSLVAHKYMKQNHIENLRQFFEQYISETSEYVVDVSGEIKQKNIVKSFNNRISLQKLINSHINFKTGEEANIPRPCKINLPKTTVMTDEGIKKLPKNEQVLTYLRQTELQADIQLEINALAAEGASKDDPGRILSLMADSQNNALSPFLVGKSNQSKVSHLNQGMPEDYKEFVRESPKIEYTLKCIATVKKHHEKTNTPVSGQVIYMDRGKQFFRYIKEYLEKELGYKKDQKLKSNPRLKVDEVEIMQGGMSTTKKEKIKDAFNEGTCKVIIGTSTIKEGMNLQEKSTVLYNLYPNWNPTDIRQLEGRVWRQKNFFNFVRIAMPLMENSMDIFVFQKLEEKTSRINALWNKSDRGNVLDEEALDPEEVKFALVTDIAKLMRFELKKIGEELKASKYVLVKRVVDLENFEKVKSAYEGYRKQFIEKIHAWIKTFPTLIVVNDGNRYIKFQDIPVLKEELPQTLMTRIERHQKVYDQLMAISQGNHDDKLIIQTAQAYYRLTNSYDYHFERYKTTVSQYGKIKKTLFQDRGYSEDTNLSVIKEDLEKELQEITIEVEDLDSPDFQEKIYNDLVEKKKKYGVKSASVADRVKQFASMNHLLDFKFEKTFAENCEIPEKHKIKPAKKIDNKRLRLAKAKAKAILIQLELEKAA